MNKAPTLLSQKKRKNAKDLFKTYGYLLLCMAIPAFIMYLIYLCKGLYPFGNGCVLVLDLNAQYVWFFEALRNFVRGDASLLYSFARSMGGEFLGIYAYYIASPLSFLLALFPEKMMLEGLLFLFLLKTAICGGTFGFYMHKTLKDPKPWVIISFSVFYALSSYAVVQQHNTMWIDALMWLPLITLGIEQLIKYGKFKLYTAFLALTLFSNFYIGYMVCIYCLIYFFLYYLAHNENYENNPRRESKHFIKSLLRIALYSAIAIGIAAVILLAAYYSLNFGKTTFSDPDYTWETKFDILDLLYKFLPGSFDTVRPEGYPFVYCGLLTLLLLPCYFLSHKYSNRQKICSGIFIFIFVACFSLSVPDLIWHGFQAPNWLNARYSFMLCFYLCVLGCRALDDFDRMSLRTVMGTGGLIALLCVILQKYSSGEYVEPDDYTCIWFSLIMIFAYLAMLGIMKKTTDRQFAAVFMVSIIGIEVFLNGLWNLNGLDEDVTFSKYSYYNDFLNRTRPITELVQERDDSFYRMEKTFSRKVNDNMALNIRGLSGSTSTLNKETIQFLNRLGYVSKSHWSQYFGGTPVNDSILGIKYLLSDKDIYKEYYEVYAEDAKTGYTAYYNPYALSIAYGVDEALLEFEMGYTNIPPETDDVLDKDDETLKLGIIKEWVNALKDKLNTWFDIDETVNNSEYIDHYNDPFTRLNAIVTAMLGEEEAVNVFTPHNKFSDITHYNLTKGYAASHTAYTKIDADSEAGVKFVMKNPPKEELFLYLPTNYPREVEITLETAEGVIYNPGDFNSNDTSGIISLGSHDTESITIKIVLKDNNLYILENTPFIYTVDWDIFKDAFARLGADQYNVTEHTEDSLFGTFTASKEKELVMTTIAYDRGWQIKVDGKEVEPIKLLGAVIGFYVEGEAGQTHEISLVYKPQILIIGLSISAVSLGLFLLLIALEKPMKKVPFLRATVSVPQNKQKGKR